MKTIIVREREYNTNKEVRDAKRGVVKGMTGRENFIKGIKIIIIPEWVIQAIESGRIK